MYALQNHNIWQRGLYESVNNRHVSVIATFRNLMQCDLLTFTLDNHFAYFNNLACGLIKANSEVESRRWWVTQKSATTLKWDILKFMVYKPPDSLECLGSYVEWMEHQKTSRRCGHMLPWQQYSGGNITINQQFIVTLKQSQTFTFLFYVISSKKYIEFPQATFKKFAHIIPLPNHKTYDGDMRFYLIGSSPLQILNMNIIILMWTGMEGFVLYDGPSQLCPKLFPNRADTSTMILNQNTSNTNEIRVKTASFQALLIINVVKKHAAANVIVTWSGTDAETIKFNDGYFKDISLGTSENGLIHLHTINNHRCPNEKWNTFGQCYHISISLSTLVQKDTVSSNIGLCQFGGLWVYGYNREDSPKKEILFQHCSVNHINNMAMFSPWDNTIIAVVQYHQISTSMGKYRIIPHMFERESIRFSPNNHRDELQTLAIHGTVDVLQILVYLKHAITAHFASALSKSFQLKSGFIRLKCNVLVS